MGNWTGRSRSRDRGSNRGPWISLKSPPVYSRLHYCRHGVPQLLPVNHSRTRFLIPSPPPPRVPDDVRTGRSNAARQSLAPLTCNYSLIIVTYSLQYDQSVPTGAQVLPDDGERQTFRKKFVASRVGATRLRDVRSPRRLPNFRHRAHPRPGSFGYDPADRPSDDSIKRSLIWICRADA